MTTKRTSLLFDGAHYRIDLPSGMIEEKGWKKGDSILLDENNGTITLRKDGPKKESPTIYSIGYEGKTIDEFIVILHSANIQQLIDVRENPFSYKKGFSKTPLRNSLVDEDIQYIHIKELGTEKQSRNEYKSTGDISRLCKTFSRRLEKSKDQYNLLTVLASNKNSAIMCFEQDFKTCHRQVIEGKLADDGFKIVHLGQRGRTNERENVGTRKSHS